MRCLASIQMFIFATSFCLGGDYVPLTEPGSKAKIIAPYRELKDAESRAGKTCDRLYPQPARVVAIKAGGERNKKWHAAYDREHQREFAAMARLTKKSVDELLDIEVEGDANAWFADPKKRANVDRLKTPEATWK